VRRRGGGSTAVAGSLDVVDDEKRGAGDLSPERSILLRCTSRPDPRALHPRAHDAVHGIYRAWRKVADGYEGDRTFVAEAYRIAEHVRRLDALPEPLDLHDATVVPQDWGGPIGLSWAVAHPERVGRLFILNTYAHRPRGRVALRFRCGSSARPASARSWSRGSASSIGSPVPGWRAPPRAAHAGGQARLPRATPHLVQAHRRARLPARDPVRTQRTGGRARRRARARARDALSRPPSADRGGR
jgi:pimeloyl-ACP methyl ester carboxylesterase